MEFLNVPLINKKPVVTEFSVLPFHYYVCYSYLHSCGQWFSTCNLINKHSSGTTIFWSVSCKLY